MAVWQSTEDREMSIFALSYSSSPSSTSLTRYEHVCNSLLSLYFLWTTIFEGRGLASATDESTRMPVPCSQHCNSISHKASYSADQNFLTTKKPPTHSTPTQQRLELHQCVCMYNQFTAPM